MENILMLNKLSLLGMGCILTMGAAHANGFYAGGSVGYQAMYDSRPGGENTLDGLTYIVTSNTSGIFQAHGVMGSLFVGYGMNVGDMGWLAFEINGELANNKMQTYDSLYVSVPANPISTSLAGSQTLTEKGALGITARPGINFSNNAKLYGIVGYERGRFNGQGTGIFVTDGIPSSLAVNQTHGLNGFRYGAGVMFPITTQVSLRAEINQTQYKEFELSSTNGDDAIDDAYKPTTTATSIGLVWSFDAPAVSSSVTK
jgi:opacity protein-like surface antigen